MFKRILVPVDGSPLASSILSFAAPLARAADAELVLLYVSEQGEDVTAPAIPDGADGGGTSIYDYLQQTAGRLRDQGLRAHYEIAAGDAREQIPVYARDGGYDLVAMSTRGRQGLERMLSGNTADTVVRAEDVPVLTLHADDDGAPPAEGERAIQSIIVPLDGTTESEAAMRVAEDLAEVLKVGLLLVRVVNPTIGAIPAAPSAISPTFDPQQLDYAEAEAVQYLEEWGRDVQRKGLTASAQLLRGLPAEAIARYAEEAPASLIVMSTHGRGIFGRILHGSVADDLVVAARRPVLLVNTPQE